MIIHHYHYCQSIGYICYDKIYFPFAKQILLSKEILEMHKSDLLQFGALATPKRCQHTGESPLRAAKGNENNEIVKLLEPQSGAWQ